MFRTPGLFWDDGLLGICFEYLPMQVFNGTRQRVERLGVVNLEKIEIKGCII